MSSIRDALRYRALFDWLKLNGVETAGLPTSYRELRDEALTRGLVRFAYRSRSDTEPFAIGLDFYGEDFDLIVDEIVANAHKQ